MIGESFQFGGERAQPDRAIGHGQLQRGFGGLRKRIGVGDGAVARDAAGELRGPGQIGAGHQALDALVGIAQPRFQPDHGLAAGGEAEMAGLDGARMHRADRDLVHAVAPAGA